MATITKVEEFKKQNGKKSWKFTLSDGTTGYITNDKPWEYKEGEAVTYTCEDKGSYKLLTLTRGSQSSAPTSAPLPSQASELPAKTPTLKDLKLRLKAEAAVSAMEFAMDTYTKERNGFEWEKVIPTQKEMAQTLWSQIDEIFSQG